MGHKGHYGEYTGNAKWSKVTNSNMGATKRDDEAHMKYLKEDIDYDNKHGHSDSSMTSDEKHISKLAGDLKYDEKKHGSPAHIKGSQKDHGHSSKEFADHEARVGTDGHSPAKMVSPLNDKTGEATQRGHMMTNEAFAKHQAVHDRDKDTKARIKEKADKIKKEGNKPKKNK
jgi:hypothetical protein